MKVRGLRWIVSVGDEVEGHLSLCYIGEVRYELVSWALYGEIEFHAKRLLGDVVND